MAKRHISIVFAVSLCVAGSARGEEEPAAPTTGGEASIGFPSFFGISGMRNLVDARTPSALQLRGLLGYAYTKEITKGEVAERTIETDEASVTASGSFLSFLEAGGHFPFYVVKNRSLDVFHTFTERTHSVGILSFDLGLKAGRSLDYIDRSVRWLALSPYILMHVTGGPGIERLDGFFAFELGGAASVALLDDLLSFHLNVGYEHLGVRTAGVRSRLGILGVPIGDPDDFVLRLGAYAEGLSVLTGRERHDAIDVSLGVQTLTLGHLIIEVTGGYRVYEGLANQLRDRGTGGLEANAGGRIDF